MTPRSGTHPKPLDRGEKIGVVLMLGMGTFIALLGTGLIPASDGDAPPPIAFTAGGVFILAGLALAFRSRPQINAALAAGILVGMACLGGWVSVFGGREGFSGGIPFLPAGANVAIARMAFGGGALLVLAMVPLVLGTAFGRRDPGRT